ncbi:MAG: right-handed parallel beta-helix repeat-containing protein [Bryobacterales bacterium]|nr:right-handed parallel beta-helix repeat-containing protein [Bryobacterales bacterium]
MIFAILSAEAGWAQTPCGVIDRDTRLTTDCAGPLTVAKDGIDINLGWHRVVCLLGPDGTRTGPGVELLNRRNVTLRNGVVGDLCSTGIQVTGGGGHQLSQLEVSGNYESLVVTDSGGNRITQSVFANNYRGPHFWGSTGNTLVSLVIRDNEKTGLSFDSGSNDNVIDMATVARNGSKVRGLCGVIFGDASRNLLLRSTVKENYVGLWLGTGNVVVDSVVKQSARTGLYVLGDLNLVLDNEVNANGSGGPAADGLVTSGDPTLVQPDATLNLIRGNTAIGNARYDLADYATGSCEANYWLLNRGVKLLDGCEADQRPQAIALAGGSGRLASGQAFSFIGAAEGAAGLKGGARLENMRDASGTIKRGVVEASLSCLTVNGGRAVAGFVVTQTTPADLFSPGTVFHVYAMDAGKSTAGFPDRAWVSRANQGASGACEMPEQWTSAVRLERGEVVIHGRNR